MAKPNKEAPISRPEGEKVEFSFNVVRLVDIKNSCLALRDFRHCGLPSMRLLFYNNKLLQELMDDLSGEEEILQALRQTVYGAEAATMDPKELELKRKELTEAQKKFNTTEHIVKLYVVSKDEFKSSLNNLDQFGKKLIYAGQQNQQEIDTLSAYMELEIEGVIA